jgi:hypothetical protein
MQNEDPRMQVPFWQSFEQHSALAPHPFPAVLHDKLRAAQVPLLHCPPQHSPLPEHAPLSETHALVPQTPFTQLRLQQSVAAEQFPPAWMQAPSVLVHVFVAESQVPEQQLCPVVHGCP